MRISTAIAGALLGTALLVSPNASAQDDASRASLDGTETDTVKLAAGISLIGAGGLAAVGGTISYFAFSASNGEQCDAGSCVDTHKNAKTASILSMVLGGAGLAVGIPLVITADGEGFGLGKRRRRNAWVPEVRVGLAAGSATWTF
jgi:hypothetical protein